MLIDLLQSINKIYLAYGATDFRKQISSLCGMIRNEYKMNPYDKSAYILSIAYSIYCIMDGCFFVRNGNFHRIIPAKSGTLEKIYL